MFRTLLTFAVVGTLVGIVLATLAAPSFIRADLCGFTADQQTSRPCLNTVQDSTSRLITAQRTGGAVGTGVGVGLGAFFIVWRKRRAAAKGQLPPDAKPPA